MKLNVGQVGLESIERSHGLQRSRPVSGHSKIVGVDVDRVRQVERVGCLGNGANDLSRGDIEAGNNLVEIRCVTRSGLFPKLDAARIDNLGRVAPDLVQ